MSVTMNDIIIKPPTKTGELSKATTQATAYLNEIGSKYLILIINGRRVSIKVDDEVAVELRRCGLVGTQGGDKEEVEPYANV